MKLLAATFLFSALSFSANAQGILKDYYLHTFAGGTVSGDTAIKGKGIDVDVGSGYSVGIAAGRSITKYLRLELEWAYRNNDVDDLRDPSGMTMLGYIVSNPSGYKMPGNITSVGTTKDFNADITYSSILVNAYYDYSPTDKLSMFGGLGLGLSIAQANFFGEHNFFATPNFIPSRHDYKGVAFTYQILLGIGYKINENFSLNFAYKLFAPGEFEEIDNLYLSSFDFGATYIF